MSYLYCVCGGEGEVFRVAVREATRTYRVFSQRCICEGRANEQEGVKDGEVVIPSSSFESYKASGYVSEQAFQNRKAA